MEESFSDAWARDGLALGRSPAKIDFTLQVGNSWPPVSWVFSQVDLTGHSFALSVVTASGLVDFTSVSGKIVVQVSEPPYVNPTDLYSILWWYYTPANTRTLFPTAAPAGSIQPPEPILLPYELVGTSPDGNVQTFATGNLIGIGGFNQNA